MTGRIRGVRLGIFLNVGIGIVFIIAAGIVVITVNDSMRQQALIEAHSKARVILDRNLATHTYFSQIMKPSIFAWSEPFRSKEYFDHTWMSSTYAIREIEKYFKSLNPSGYSFKDAAIDARSPENEADEYERVFLEKLAMDKKLESESTIRTIGGAPYLVVLRKGEVMEASCLKCHSHPKNAPKGLTDNYGSERSFNRKAGDLVSAVSLRIPLAEAYASANIFSWKLSAILIAVLLCLFAIQSWLYRRYLLKPLNVMRGKAREIASFDGHLGEQIPQPLGRELSELTATFNEMSVKLRYDRDHMEELVNQRTEELRESEGNYRSLFENMLDGFAYCKMEFDEEEHPVDFVYLDVNTAFESLTGLKDVVGKKVTEVIPEIKVLSPELFEKYGRVALTGKSERFEIDFKPVAKWLLISVYSTRKGYFVAVFDDITSRKLSEEKIKASLLEKETMLKEIHHRVKNNLQVISSLLNLQSSYLQDEKAREMFQNSMDRVKIMAKIHTMLYQSEDLARVDFSGFIKDLAGRVQQSYGSVESPVAVHVNVSDVSLTIETSIPCGLILNELVSNAFKHAFPKGRGGEIHISMTTAEGRFVLTVRDNGIGFPAAVDFQNRKSLGLELVNLLVGQMNGKIDMQVDGGTTFTITFPAVSKGG